jgi:hypothetical protein
MHSEAAAVLGGCAFYLFGPEIPDADEVSRSTKASNGHLL